MASGVVHAESGDPAYPNAFSRTETHVGVPEAMPYVVSHAFAFQGMAVGEKPKALPPPSRPFFGGHCIAEAGGAFCAPKLVMLLFRLAALAAGILVVIFFGRDALREAWTVPLYSWVAATALSSLCSLRYLTASKTEASLPSYMEGSRYVFLANITVPLYQFAFMTYLFIAPLIFFSFKPDGGITLPRIATAAFPVAVLFVDVLLSLRHRFKLFYALFPIAYAAVYLLVHYFVFSDAVYPNLDANKQSSTSLAIYYGSAAGWALASTLIVCIIHRLLARVRRADPLADEMRFARDTRLFTVEDTVEAIEASHQMSSEQRDLSSTGTDDGAHPETHSPTKEAGGAAYDVSRARGPGPYRPSYSPQHSADFDPSGEGDDSHFGHKAPQLPVSSAYENSRRSSREDAAFDERAGSGDPYNAQRPSDPSNISRPSPSIGVDQSLFPPVNPADETQTDWNYESNRKEGQPAYPAYPAYPAFTGDPQEGQRRRARR